MPQFNENFSGMIRIPLFDNTKSFNGTLINRLDKTNQYPATFYINPTNRFKISGSIDIKNEIKFPGTFVNAVVLTQKFPGLVFIEPDNHLEGVIDIKGMDKRNYPGLVKIAPIRDLRYQGFTSVPLFEDSVQYSGTFTNAKEYLNLYKGKLTIPPQNLLEGKVLVKGMGMPKFPGIFVNRAWRVPQFPARVTISRYDQEINYPGLVTTRIYNDKLFKGKVSITPQNVMEGRIEITDTPINRYYGVIVKDTNTVVNQPDNNYGLERDIYFGNGLTTLAQWRFNQNKDIYYRPNQEIGAMFRMYLKRALPEDSTIRIYTIDTTWNEYTVTENTKPQMTLLYTGIVKRNTIGVMDFDLGDLLAGYNKQSIFEVALAIQIDTASGTINNSRETLVNPLGLYYDYHYVPPSMRTRLFGGTIKIRLDKERRFKGKVKILSDNADDRFPGLVSIHGTEVNKAYPGYFFLNAPKNRSPVIPGLVSVPKYDRDISYPGAFTNKLERQPQYPGFVKVPLWEVNNNYPGTITIPSNNKELNYPGIITNRLDGELNISGIITTRLDKETKFKGLVTIARFDIDIDYPGDVNIPLRYFETFEGFTSVPLFENTLNYPGDVNVPRRYFRVRKGIVRIKRFSGSKDFKATFKLLYTPFKVVKGNIKVAKFDRQNNYPGTITIRLDKEAKFKGLVTVPRYDIDVNYPGFIHILETHFHTAKGIVTIPVFDDNEVLYKGTFVNKIAEEIRYKGIVRVKSDRKKVRIFIM